jgi:hypothetical protein
VIEAFGRLHVALLALRAQLAGQRTDLVALEQRERVATGALRPQLENPLPLENADEHLLGREGNPAVAEQLLDRETLFIPRRGHALIAQLRFGKGPARLGRLAKGGIRRHGCRQGALSRSCLTQDRAEQHESYHYSAANHHRASTPHPDQPLLREPEECHELCRPGRTS